MPAQQKEKHGLRSVGWMRAAVLGANDGIVSTASLVLGVAAADTPHHSILVAGAAGLVAGAMSMAAGEYVSVHSQADTERAAIEAERAEIADDEKGGTRELASIYIRRGLDPALAREVARQLMARDPLGAHARDHLGISSVLRARPLQAALTSAASFGSGAALPLIVVAFAPATALTWMVAAASLLFLALLGALAAYVGNASLTVGALRVTFWSALAMAVTTGLGKLLGGVGVS